MIYYNSLNAASLYHKIYTSTSLLVIFFMVASPHLIRYNGHIVLYCISYIYTTYGRLIHVDALIDRGESCPSNLTSSSFPILTGIVSGTKHSNSFAFAWYVLLTSCSIF